MKNMKRLHLLYYVLAVVLLVLPFLMTDQYTVQILNMIGIYTLLGTGINILTGYTGQISLGQAAFFGIGAYGSAILNINYHMSILITLPIAILITAVFGIILAVPALKVKGSYLSLLTIGFGEIIRLIMVNWTPVTKGTAGIVGIDSPNILGFQFDSLQKYYYLILIFVILGFLYQKTLIKSRVGRALMAIRDDDKAAELTGINITNYKIKGFVIGAIYSSIAGVLYAHMITYVSPDSFTSNDSNIILWTAIVGGMGTLFGPIAGATIMTLLPELLRPVGNLRMVIYGILLLLLIMYYPGGVTKYVTKIKESIAKKIALRKAAQSTGKGE